MSKRNVEKPDVRKAEIVNLAKNLFLQKGYDDVSVREIIQATDSAGSPGLFYYYFGSKKDVYEEVLDLTVRQELLQRMDLVSEAGTPKAKILRFLETLESDFRNQKRLLKSGKAHHVVDEISARLVDGEIPMAEEILKELIASNGEKEPIVSSAHCRDLACFVVYGVNGVLRGAPSIEGAGESDGERFAYVRSLLSNLLDMDLSIRKG